MLDATDDADCDDTPSGTAEAECRCLDGVIAAVTSGGGGGGGDSFVTINAPSGTDPVADSATDTLNITCAAPLACPGDSSTDTIAFSLTGLILDIGDDGGNDSVALAELSTVNDDY